jgi:Ni/Co efflux regulator RcnB
MSNEPHARMKSNSFSRKLVAIAVAAATAVPAVGFAQSGPREARQDAREARRDIREAQRDLRRADTPREAREARQDMREARRDLRDAREARRYYNAREFRRGGRLPPELRDRQYVVSNWRAHRLAPPPRGYQWVQVGPDYVLAAVATGIIANLILSQ